MHPIVFVSDPPLLNNISDTKPCPLFPHTFRLSMDFHYNEALILQPIIHGTIQSEFVVYWVGFNLWSSCVNIASPPLCTSGLAEFFFENLNRQLR